MNKLIIINFVKVHIATNESVECIKVKRPQGVRYIVFWQDDPEPTIYKPSEFDKKFK